MPSYAEFIGTALSDGGNTHENVRWCCKPCNIAKGEMHPREWEKVRPQPTEADRFAKLSHMVADTREELLAMCDTIGVQRKWIQHEGRYSEHFDIAQAKRALAIKAGAIEVTFHDFGVMMRNRKQTGALLPAPPR